MQRLIYIQQHLKVAKNKNGFGYKYRDAESILEAAKPALDYTKCAVICDAKYEIIEGSVYKTVTASLYGEDGKIIASARDMVKSPDKMNGMVAQQVSGSDTTYCKRYALQNLFAIDNGEDDFDCKSNPLNPKNQKGEHKGELNIQSKMNNEQPEPQPEPQHNKLDDVTNAVQMNTVQQKLDNMLAAEKISKEVYDKKMVQLIAHGTKIGCTHTDVEGWIDNNDLFGND